MSAAVSHSTTIRAHSRPFAVRFTNSAVPFLLPALTINAAIILIPGLLTIAMAFCDWDGATAPSFVGFDNFRTIFADPVFFSAFFNNIKWTLIFLT
ncbi:MAG TPA: hypothetical protein VHY59_09490, partial [Chthoniobacterales bacterium]|nr:hypothetical protein [Chthoniobacterales bacterium]